MPPHPTSPHAPSPHTPVRITHHPLGRAQEPLRHAERLAMWHQPVRSPRRRTLGRALARTTAIAAVCALLGLSAWTYNALPTQPQAIVIGRAAR